MRIKSVHIRDFKRFTDFQITDLPEAAKLVVLIGPNGSGKSSLFDAFSYWISWSKYGAPYFHREYHLKVGTQEIKNSHDLLNRIDIQFYGDKQINNRNPQDSNAKKAFYFRSGYRHEAAFTLQSITKLPDPLQDPHAPKRMIDTETRVSENYQRLISNSIHGIFDGKHDEETVQELRNYLIGKITDAMQDVFPDLKFEGLRNPLEDGTFFFTKGTSSHFKYLNLSAGEKSAFDLLLDFIVKSEHFNETIFCIDEPELHMHTALQGRLLQKLYECICDRSQLWIATHSVGMIRKAFRLAQDNPESVVFLDFGGINFDNTVQLKPIMATKAFWRKAFHVVLDDLADLVAPSNIVLCEGGRRETGARRNVGFDSNCLNRIFGDQYPDWLFISAGGTQEVERHGAVLLAVLKEMLPGVSVFKLIDRDDRTDREVEELRKQGTRVLSRRDLENYLWDDEILQKLCHEKGLSHLWAEVREEKRQILQKQIEENQHPTDDIKAASGQLYNMLKRKLRLTRCGNDAVSFCIDTLAPLVTPETQVYKELEADIFGGLVPS